MAASTRNVGPANEHAHRQLDELIALGITGRLIIHLAGGNVRKLDLEAVLMSEGKQHYVIVPTPRTEFAPGREG